MSADLPRQETRDAASASWHASPPDGAVIRALVVTDLVDSTALYAHLGDRRAMEVDRRHDETARALLAEHDGREIDKSDGFLLLFERPIDAVAFALDYHAALAGLARELGVRLEARAGIHLGEIFLRSNPPEAVSRGAKPLEVEGLAKATAARVMSLALGRQTLMTQGAYELARRAAIGKLDEAEVRWLDHGFYSLKGIDEPIGVFEVGVIGAAPLANPVDRTKAVRLAEAHFPAASEPAVATSPPPDSRGSATGGWRRAARPAGLGLLLATLMLVLALLPGVRRRLGELFTEPGAAGAGARPAVEAAGRPAGSDDELAVLEPYELYRRGVAYLDRFDKKGNLDKATEAFQRLLALEPDSAPGYAGLARSYWLKHYSESKDPQWAEQALAVARRAVELDGYLAAARVSLGLAHAALGQAEEADREYDQALRLDPASADAHWARALLVESQGRLDDAASLYRQAIELEPGDRFPHDLLGSLDFRRGRYSEAEASFRRSIELAPDGIYGYRNLAGVFLIHGRDAEAANLLQQALEIRRDPSLYSNLGTIFFVQGLYPESAAAYEQAMEILGGSNDYRLWGNLGDAYRWTPDRRDQARRAYGSAVRLLIREIERAPDDPALRSRLALFRAKQGECPAALTEAEAIGAAAAPDANLLYRLAVTYEACGRREAALESLGRALRAGYSTRDAERDPELRQLRADPRYHLLMSDVEGTRTSR